MRRDRLFLAVLGSIMAVPLIVLRNQTWVGDNAALVTLAVGGLALFVCWRWLSGSRHSDEWPGSSPPPHRPTARFWEPLLICGALLALTVVAFYLPARKNFWVGQDEVYNLAAEGSPWHHVYEDIAGRPLSAVLGFVALQIVPGHLDGLFWLAAALRLLTALCLSGILRMLLPQAQGVGLIAAILFIVNPSERMRFAIIAIFPYYEMLFLLALAVWLFLLSDQRQQRWLLVLACLVLIAALLHYEGAFTLAILAPVLLRLRGRSKHAGLWAAAWIGTMMLCALRYVSFFLSAHVIYQVTYLTTATRTFSGLLDNLKTLLLPVFSFFDVTLFRTAGAYAVPGVTAAVLVLLPLFLAFRRGDSAPSRTKTVIGIGLASLAILMSISLFVFVLPRVADPQENASTRYEFLASLPQAIFWALIIGCAGAFLRTRVQRLAMTAMTAVMVLSAVIGTYDAQDHRNILSASLDTRYIDFNLVSGIFQQAQNLMPPISTDTAIFFQIKDDAVSPFGWDYHLLNLSCLMFGAPGYVGRYSPDSGWLVRTRSNLVRSDNPGAGLPTSAADYKVYEFPKVVMFDVTSDGQVTLHAPPDTTPRLGQVPGTVNSIDPCLVDKLQTSRYGFPLPYLTGK